MTIKSTLSAKGDFISSHNNDETKKIKKQFGQKGIIMEHNKKLHGFFRDDGTEINPELVPKPGLCILCCNDDNPNEEIPCILTRADQQGESEFICHAFKPKNK